MMRLKARFLMFK